MKKLYLHRALKLTITAGLVIALTACGGNDTYVAEPTSAQEPTLEEVMAQLAEERGQEYSEILTALVSGEPSRFINLANENRWVTTAATLTTAQQEQVTDASLVGGVFRVEVS